MKLRISPPPTPYHDADPDDVVVTEVRRCFDRNGPYMEAWGYLRSEMRLSPDITTFSQLKHAIFPQDYEPSEEYIIGHSNIAGQTWYQEGDLIGTLLDESIVSQIERLMEGPRTFNPNKEV